MPSILMPQLVEHMTEALVTRWLLADGDPVAIGDEVVEVETDKATTAIESEFEGAIRIIAAEGESVPVGEPLCEVGAETAPTPEATVEPDAAGDRDRILASPLARRLAADNGIDLAELSSSKGKIGKAEVEAAIAARNANEQDRGEDRAAKDQGGGETRLPEVSEPAQEPVGVLQKMSRTQRTIARRMSESKATIPDFAVSIHVDMEACVALRRQLKELASASGEPAPSFNDIIVKATALTLRAYPKANSSYQDGAIELRPQVNIGVAVAAEGSLVVPTIVEADRATLGGIARRSRELAAAVRDRSITAADLAGGTFTVSNLGMFGVSDFTAVVNPPQAGILAVGSIEERVVHRDGEIVPRAMTTLTLCSDHRVIYGAEAAQFVAHLKGLLENPMAMAL